MLVDDFPFSAESTLFGVVVALQNEEPEDILVYWRSCTELVSIFLCVFDRLLQCKGVVAHTCNPGTWEQKEEAYRKSEFSLLHMVGFRPARTTE